MTENNKCFYGAGACYGKGALLMWFHALHSYKKFKQELPVKVKFVIESMHEKQNAGLEQLLHSKKLNFLADVDYIVVNESAWLGEKMPCLTYGAVGKNIYSWFKVLSSMDGQHIYTRRKICSWNGSNYIFIFIPLLRVTKDI